MQLILSTARRSFLHRLLLGALAIFTLSGTAQAWWNTDWTIR
jgi:hypothetical protein